MTISSDDLQDLSGPTAASAEHYDFDTFAAEQPLGDETQAAHFGAEVNDLHETAADEPTEHESSAGSAEGQTHLSGETQVTISNQGADEVQDQSDLAGETQVTIGGQGGDDVHGPAEGVHDGVVGDPEASAPYWFEQAENGWCGPASVSEIVAQATGSTNLEATELEVVAKAEQLGFLTHTGTDFTSGWSGMQPADIATLLQSFGVPAAQGQGSISELEQALSNGDQAIAAVDSSTIWNAEGAESVADPGQADHALVVTGIDEKAGIVYLNDPGRPEGGETHVSLAVFEKAWATSGDSLVVANAGAAQPETTAGEPLPAGDFAQIVASEGQKTYILPITLTSPFFA